MCDRIPKPWSPEFRSRSNSGRTHLTMPSTGSEQERQDHQPFSPLAPNIPPRRQQPHASHLQRQQPVARQQQSLMSSYPMYNQPWNSYMSPYNGMMMNQMSFNNSFLTERVDEHLRPALDSVYSVVQAFGSVSMVLESSYMAVTSSIRAVVGLADHFGRLSQQLRGLVTSMAGIRFLRNVWRRLLIWLGRAKPDQRDRAWAEIMGAQSQNGKTKSPWPVLAFLLVIFGGPALIWKLVMSLAPSEKEKLPSFSAGKCFMGRVKFNFVARNRDELSVKLGDNIRIAPKEEQVSEPGWLLVAKADKKGLIPATYVNIIGTVTSVQPTKNSLADLVSNVGVPPKSGPDNA